MSAAGRALADARDKLTTLGRPYSRGGGVLDRVAARLRLPLDRRNEARNGRLAELAELGARVAERVDPAAASSAPRVLVLSLRVWPTHAAYESVIAHALRLRGAEVALLTCGGGQPVCEMGWARRAWPRPCDRCAWYTDRLAAAAQLEHYRLADGFPWGADARRASPLAEGAVDPETAARVSLPWFLRAADADFPEARPAASDFAISARAIEHSVSRVLDEFRPDVVFSVNGLFTPEAVVRELCRVRGVRAPTYEMAPRGDALVFAQEDPAPEYGMDAAWAAVKDRPLTPRQRDLIDRLLEDRARGEGAHERYFESQEDDPAAVRAALRIPSGSRVLALFTNLTWDSAALYHDIGYASMTDWVARTVRSAGDLRDTVLVVRVHPAEAKWGTREQVRDVVEAQIGRIPDNVRFVAADEALSSYALLQSAEAVLAYTTTVGLEAAVRGVPAIVAGETHYRGRGFTVDVDSHDQLERAIGQPLERLSGDQVDLARRYAYTFFFRAMIPFHAVRIGEQRTQFVATDPELLAPGRDRHLDFVCARILDGGDFTLPDELAEL